MPKTKIFPIVILLFYALSSCNSDGVKLIDKNFTDEIPLNANLTFTFDRDLVPDSIVGYWDSTEYITFKPTFPGAFKWVNNRELVFSPSGTPSPGQEYQANLQKALVKHTKFSLAGDQSFTFRSPYLQLESLIARWVVDDETNESYAKINAKFNYILSAENLAAKAKINLEDKDRPFEVVSKTNDRTFAFKLTDLEKHEDDLTGQLVLDKSLNIKLREGDDESGQFGFVLMSPYKIEVLNVSTEHDGDEGSILIYTSQPFKSEDLSKFIQLEPQVDFEIDQQTDFLSLRSRNLDPNTTYSLTIADGVRGVHGGKLRAKYKTNISFGRLRPELNIKNSDGMFISGKGEKVLELDVTAVPEIRIRISKIYENNILSAINGYYSPGYFRSESDYDFDYYHEDYSSGGYTKGDIIYDEIISTDDLPGNKFSRKLRLNLEDKLGNYDGIYHIHVASSNDYWLSDSRFISISDIGIIAKYGDNQMQVFCNSIYDTKAISNAEVRLFGSNNQLIGKTTTDGDGFANLELNSNEYTGFKPSFITIKKDKDFNFLPLSKTNVNTSRYDVGGRHSNPSGLECYVYPERDIYRPGETINAVGIVRNTQNNIGDKLPVRVVLRLPNGKVYKELRKSLNDQASFEFNQELPRECPTGVYQIEVSTFNDILLTSESIMVEEFMPDRIKVNTELDKHIAKNGDDIKLDVEAINFFGPPAANRNVEVEVQTSRDRFSPQKYCDYNFYLDGASNDFQSKVYEASTDDQGKAEFSHYIPNFYANQGKLKAKLYTTVFDENGRSVSKTNEVTIFTQSSFVGLRSRNYYVGTNTTNECDLVVLNSDEKRIKAEVIVELVRYEYRTVMERSGSYYNYRSQKFPITISKKNFEVDGTAKYSFKTEHSGRHELRVKVKGQKHDVVYNFYAYSWGSSSNNSFEVDKEGNIDLVLDKKEYEAGEYAKVLFKTPFNGKMLVTIEQDKVLKHQYIDVKNKSAELNIKLLDDYLPNVYVSATLFKPHRESDMPLTVAHGYHSISVQKSSRKIPVKIEVPAKSRSGKTQKIKVRSTANAYVSIAVVDEGILQVSGFETPDPYNNFYGKRALGIQSYDLYPYLFKETSYRSAIAGDGMMRKEMLNPVNSNRVKLVSYWSGVKKANGSGITEFEIEIPQFSGDLRVMAVAHYNNRFGSADQNMIVADPLVLSASVPRFLSIGDSLDLSLSLSNTTESMANSSTSLTTKGPLKIVGSNKVSVKIGPNTEERIMYKLVVTKAIGEAEISFETQALGETFNKDYKLPVRSAAALQSQFFQGYSGETKKKFNVDLNQMIPGTGKLEVTLGRSPLIQLSKDLSYLVKYPHGCMEQTISGAFPQLYLQDLLQVTHPKLAQKSSYHIKEALNKIKLHSLYNGAMSLWPGNGTASWWSTVYACHFMLECQKAGYSIDQRILEHGLSYLQYRLRDKQRVDFYYVGGYRRIAPREVCYSLYVLSMANMADKSSMNYYRMNLNDLSNDSKYLLAAAYYMGGDRSLINKIIPDNWDTEQSKNMLSGSFASDIRDKAVMLNALIEINPEHPQVAGLTKYIVNGLNTSRYLNTQERAWSLLGIGKIAKMRKSQANAELWVDGEVYGKYDLSDNKNIRLSDQVRSIEVKGIGGRVYYSIHQEGVSMENQVLEEDSYMKVRRTLYDRFGRQLQGNTFNQNDLIIVKVEVNSGTYSDLENLAISDVLPAGFEVENMRLKDVPGMSWVKNATTPTYTDIRDDRIILYVDAYPKSNTFYYALRAVSKGDFHWAPLNAECMYNEEVHSSNNARIISIK